MGCDSQIRFFRRSVIQILLLFWRLQPKETWQEEVHKDLRGWFRECYLHDSEKLLDFSPYVGFQVDIRYRQGWGEEDQECLWPNPSYWEERGLWNLVDQDGYARTWSKDLIFQLRWFLDLTQGCPICKDHSGGPEIQKQRTNSKRLGNN